MPDLPPWLNVQPSQFLEATERGTQAGLQNQAQQNQAAEAQARLTHEDQMAKMEAEMRKQVLQQNFLRQNAQLENIKAYREAQVGLAQGRLQEQQVVNQAKAQHAARMFAAQQKYSQLLQSGVSPQKALYQVPELSTPSAVAAMGRSAGTRDYGAIQTQNLPGGQTIAYRAGSPGLHVIPPKQSINDRVFAIEMKALADRKAKFGADDPESSAEVDKQMLELRQKYEAGQTMGTGTSQGGGSKTERARQLRKENPNWTKQAIIDAVNKEFGVAPQ